MRITLLFFSIIVLMLVGVATAADDESMEIMPKIAEIPYEPNYTTYYITISDIFNTTATHEINATVVGGGAGWSPDHLRFRFTNSSGASSGWLKSGEKWNWGTPGEIPASHTGSAEMLKMDVQALSSAPLGCNYTIEVWDVGGMLTGIRETASGTVIGKTIPEFATIAIPLCIALLCALFFMRKQKH